MSAKKIARWCHKYLNLYRVHSLVDDDPVFDLVLPAKQFSNAFGTIMVTCRDRDFLCGETLFQDIRESRLRVHRGAIPIILTPSPITSDLVGFSLAYEIPIIHLTDLPHLAEALKSAAAGNFQPYRGTSVLVQDMLKPRNLELPNDQTIRQTAVPSF